MLRLSHTHSRTPAQHGGLAIRYEYIEKRAMNGLIFNGNVLDSRWYISTLDRIMKWRRILSVKYLRGNGSGPIRVLCADEITILYEPMKTFGWYFENIKTANFFVYPTDYFKDNFVILFDNSVKPPENVNRFFPSIPMRLLRHPNLFWAESPFKTIEESREFCFNNNIQTDDEIVLNVPEIYINPSSALGRIYNGPLIKSVKKIGFTLEELIFHAFSIQSKYIKPKQTSIQYGRYGPIHSGIGLYRQGIRSNKPEYYIAGYHDKAENTLRAERLQK